MSQSCGLPGSSDKSSFARHAGMVTQGSEEEVKATREMAVAMALPVRSKFFKEDGECRV